MSESDFFERATLYDLEWEYAEGIPELTSGQKHQLFARSHEFTKEAERWYI
jgi:hypothetical protein